LKNNFNKLQPSDKVFGTILLLNAIVFLAWQVPQWQHIMVKYFMTDALASKFIQFLNINLIQIMIKAYQ